MIVKNDYMHPTYCYFTLENGDVITYDRQEGIFLYRGKEYLWESKNRASLHNFLDGFETIEEFDEYLRVHR